MLVTVVRAEDSKMVDGKYSFWRTWFGIILVYRPWET